MQKQTKSVTYMGRQRNTPQSKRKEKSLEKELTKIEANNPSYIEFKIIVTRMLKEVREHYKELYESYRELSGNYSSMQKDIETMNNYQEERKNTISEIKKYIRRK